VPLEKVSIFEIITVDLLKATTLLGVDLTLDDGTPYPDEHFEQAIRAAVETMERTLGIVIDPFQVTGENHDADTENRSQWWRFDLDHRPIVGVTGFRLKYGNFDENDVPISWTREIDRLNGQINIMPSDESITSRFLYSGVAFPLIGVLGESGYVPGYFLFDYDAGFLLLKGQVEIPEGETSVIVDLPEHQASPYDLRAVMNTPNGALGLRQTGRSSTSFTLSVSTAPVGGPAIVDVTVNALGAALTQAVLLTAAMMPLDVAGDLIVGAGIASYSVSMDGISENVNTTSSATNSGYGARVIQFQKELKSLIPALRAKYSRIKMFSI